MLEYEIFEVVCSGLEFLFIECKMFLVFVLKCNMVLGIYCFLGIKKMIKYILYYIFCDESEVVMFEFFFIDNYWYFVFGF